MDLHNAAQWRPAILWGILLVVVLALVFIFSSQGYEQQSILPFLREHIHPRTLAKWLPDMTITYRMKTIDAKEMPYTFTEFIFRKSAHLFMYASFAAALYMFIRTLPVRRRSQLKAISITLVSAIIVPMIDEWNQLSTSNRTGNLTDVWLDFTGCCIGMLLCYLVTSASNRRTRRTAAEHMKAGRIDE
ncbi:VanZ like family protein [compost metagenome]